MLASESGLVGEGAVCKSCSHAWSNHVTEIEDRADDELDRFLDVVVDSENLFSCVHQEEDADTRQVGHTYIIYTVYILLLLVCFFGYCLTSLSKKYIYETKTDSDSF